MIRFLDATLGKWTRHFFFVLLRTYYGLFFNVLVAVKVALSKALKLRKFPPIRFLHSAQTSECQHVLAVIVELQQCTNVYTRISQVAA